MPTMTRTAEAFTQDLETAQGAMANASRAAEAGDYQLAATWARVAATFYDSAEALGQYL
jgi:hypothetical protein